MTTPTARPPTPPTAARPAPAGLSPRHLLLHVVRPTLAALAEADPGIDGRAAEELLIGTAAVESGFRALDQWTGPGDDILGPAIGLWQVEPATRLDVHANYLLHRPPVLAAVGRLIAVTPSLDVQLATNLCYAAAVARLVYRRSPVPLVAPGAIAGHARVWKRVYNTPLGKGTEEHFVRAWSTLVAPVLGDWP